MASDVAEIEQEGCEAYVDAFDGVRSLDVARGAVLLAAGAILRQLEVRVGVGLDGCRHAAEQAEARSFEGGFGALAMVARRLPASLQ